MAEPARRLTARVAMEPLHVMGTVVRVGDGDFGVMTDAGLLGARRAVSCLLEPERGDSVLVSGQSAERAYVIAVLERAGDGPANLVVVGDAVLRSAGGSMTLEAGVGLSLSSRTRIDLATQDLTVRSSRTTFLFERLKSIGKEMSASIGCVRLLGNVLESFFERLSLSCRQSVRTVEDEDRVQCGVMDYRAKSVMNLHGQHILASAKELVKLDGEQVHLG